MIALLTGDLGFVGRHVRADLEGRGWHVVGLDIRRGRHEDVRTALRGREGRYGLVVHCAALVGGRAKIDGDPLAIACNLGIDSELFRWATSTSQRRVLYFSSSAAYPVELQTRHMPNYRLREGDVSPGDEPDQTYGLVKLVGEQLAGHARRAGLPVTVIRPFSGYGPGQDLHYPWPAFIDRAKRREDPFQVWGDGTQQRDFVHIDDVVGLALDAALGGHDGPLNACTGRGVSFLQLAEFVTQAAGYRPAILTKPDAPTGVWRRVGEPTAMNTVRPARITLEDGIGRAFA